MFIIKKKIKGKEYYYVRESRREGKKVISKTLAYLGKSREEAEEKFNKLKEKRSCMVEKDKKQGVEIKKDVVKDNKFLHILFVCKGNKFRSKVAEAFFKKYNKNKSIEVKSAGTELVEPAKKETVEKIKKEFGIKEVDTKQLKLDDKLIDWADLIIITADNVSLDLPNKKVEKWNIPDTTEENYSEAVRIIKLIEAKVKDLIERIKKPKEQEKVMKQEKPTEKKQVAEKIKEEAKEKQEIGSRIDEITSIALRRGFFFQTANIYGGKAGFFTFGHLGKQLRMNWENLWRKHILALDDNFFEIQSNNILPEPVFKASGHIENFNDPMVECKKCHFRFRADNFLEDKKMYKEGMSIGDMQKIFIKEKLKCPKCGGELAKIKQFNMMFSVNVGFNDEKAYLSPETAQGAYLAFKEEFQATRNKLPLGLAIIDKAYRNEISPRQMFFRLREFSQAELQIFFDSEKIDEMDDKKWNEVKNYKLRIKKAKEEEIKELSCQDARDKLKLPKFYIYHMAKVQQFYLQILKIPVNKFRLRELGEDERAFYNKIHFDIEVYLGTLGGFKEVGGIHYRTDHDLAGHQKISGKNLEVFYDNKKILAHVLELSFGVDRNIWMLLDIFYNIGKEGSMFKFPANIAPYKAAILPLINKEDMPEIAKNVYNDLKKDWNVFYDDSGSIGRRYARNDEAGTPFCITIDGESLKNNDVTIRNRDDTKQVRVKIKDLKEVLRKLIAEEIEFEKAGKLVETRILKDKI